MTWYCEKHGNTIPYCDACGTVLLKKLRTEGTPEAEKLWRDVDKAAARAPNWLREPPVPRGGEMKSKLKDYLSCPDCFRTLDEEQRCPCCGTHWSIKRIDPPLPAIKPCPCCTPALSRPVQQAFKHKARVFCLKCGLTTDWYDTQAEADAAWNRREGEEVIKEILAIKKKFYWLHGHNDGITAETCPNCEMFRALSRLEDR